jgi:putative tricarboxylic transport membrane protein
MRRTHALRLTALAAGIALAASACGVTDSDSGSAADGIDGYQIMVPNSAGGGYDTTARTAAAVI